MANKITVDNMLCTTFGLRRSFWPETTISAMILGDTVNDQGLGQKRKAESCVRLLHPERRTFKSSMSDNSQLSSDISGTTTQETSIMCTSVRLKRIMVQNALILYLQAVRVSGGCKEKGK